MKVISDHEQIHKPVVLMIGNFDGVHLGHQAIFADARRLAEKEGLQTAVLSFQPHPAKLLAPQRAPKLIQTFPQKKRLLAHYGIDYFIPQTFDRAFSRLSPRAFLEKLYARIAFKHLLVGFNFHFGQKRAGNVETLRRFAPDFGFEVDVIQAHQVLGEVVSSSRIRKLLGAGEMEQVNQLLGRPYFLEGEVVGGRALGRRIEAPTANIVPVNELLPRFGVYATWTRVGGVWRRSIANLGIAPTVAHEQPRLEMHLFEFSGDLYNQHIEVVFSRFLRPEQKFDDLEQLKAQIRLDFQARLALADQQAPLFPFI